MLLCAPGTALLLLRKVKRHFCSRHRTTTDTTSFISSNCTDSRSSDSDNIPSSRNRWCSRSSDCASPPQQQQVGKKMLPYRRCHSWELPEKTGGGLGQCAQKEVKEEEEGAKTCGLRWNASSSAYCTSDKDIADDENKYGQYRCCSLFTPVYSGLASPSFFVAAAAAARADVAHAGKAAPGVERGGGEVDADGVLSHTGVEHTIGGLLDTTTCAALQPTAVAFHAASAGVAAAAFQVSAEKVASGLVSPAATVEHAHTTTAKLSEAVAAAFHPAAAGRPPRRRGFPVLQRHHSFDSNFSVASCSFSSTYSDTPSQQNGRGPLQAARGGYRRPAHPLPPARKSSYFSSSSSTAAAAQAAPAAAAAQAAPAAAAALALAAASPPKAVAIPLAAAAVAAAVAAAAPEAAEATFHPQRAAGVPALAKGTSSSSGVVRHGEWTRSMKMGISASMQMLDAPARTSNASCSPYVKRLLCLSPKREHVRNSSSNGQRGARGERPSIAGRAGDEFLCAVSAAVNFGERMQTEELLRPPNEPPPLPTPSSFQQLGEETGRPAGSMLLAEDLSAATSLRRTRAPACLPTAATGAPVAAAQRKASGGAAVAEASALAAVKSVAGSAACVTGEAAARNAGVASVGEEEEGRENVAGRGKSCSAGEFPSMSSSPRNADSPFGSLIYAAADTSSEEDNNARLFRSIGMFVPAVFPKKRGSAERKGSASAPTAYDSFASTCLPSSASFHAFSLPCSSSALTLPFMEAPAEADGKVHTGGERERGGGSSCGNDASQGGSCNPSRKTKADSGGSRSTSRSKERGGRSSRECSSGDTCRALEWQRKAVRRQLRSSTLPPVHRKAASERHSREEHVQRQKQTQQQHQIMGKRGANDRKGTLCMRFSRDVLGVLPSVREMEANVAHCMEEPREQQARASLGLREEKEYQQQQQRRPSEENNKEEEKEEEDAMNCDMDSQQQHQNTTSLEPQAEATQQPSAARRQSSGEESKRTVRDSTYPTFVENRRCSTIDSSLLHNVESSTNLAAVEQGGTGAVFDGRPRLVGEAARGERRGGGGTLAVSRRESEEGRRRSPSSEIIFSKYSSHQDFPAPVYPRVTSSSAATAAEAGAGDAEAEGRREAAGKATPTSAVTETVQELEIVHVTERGGENSEKEQSADNLTREDKNLQLCMRTPASTPGLPEAPTCSVIKGLGSSESISSFSPADRIALSPASSSPLSGEVSSDGASSMLSLAAAAAAKRKRQSSAREPRPSPVAKANGSRHAFYGGNGLPRIQLCEPAAAASEEQSSSRSAADLETGSGERKSAGGEAVQPTAAAGKERRSNSSPSYGAARCLVDSCADVVSCGRQGTLVPGDPPATGAASGRGDIPVIDLFAAHDVREKCGPNAFSARSRELERFAVNLCGVPGEGVKVSVTPPDPREEPPLLPNLGSLYRGDGAAAARGGGGDKEELSFTQNSPCSKGGGDSRWGVFTTRRISRTSAALSAWHGEASTAVVAAGGGGKEEEAGLHEAACYGKKGTAAAAVGGGGRGTPAMRGRYLVVAETSMGRGSASPSTLSTASPNSFSGISSSFSLASSSTPLLGSQLCASAATSISPSPVDRRPHADDAAFLTGSRSPAAVAAARRERYPSFTSLEDNYSLSSPWALPLLSYRDGNACPSPAASEAAYQESADAAARTGAPPSLAAGGAAAAVIPAGFHGERGAARTAATAFDGVSATATGAAAAGAGGSRLPAASAGGVSIEAGDRAVPVPVVDVWKAAAFSSSTSSGGVVGGGGRAVRAAEARQQGEEDGGISTSAGRTSSSFGEAEQKEGHVRPKNAWRISGLKKFSFRGLLRWKNTIAGITGSRESAATPQAAATAAGAVGASPESAAAAAAPTAPAAAVIENQQLSSQVTEAAAAASAAGGHPHQSLPPCGALQTRSSCLPPRAAVAPPPLSTPTTSKSAADAAAAVCSERVFEKEPPGEKTTAALKEAMNELHLVNESGSHRELSLGKEDREPLLNVSFSLVEEAKKESKKMQAKAEKGSLHYHRLRQPREGLLAHGAASPSLQMHQQEWRPQTQGHEQRWGTERQVALQSHGCDSAQAGEGQRGEATQRLLEKENDGAGGRNRGEEAALPAKPQDRTKAEVEEEVEEHQSSTSRSWVPVPRSVRNEKQLRSPERQRQSSDEEENGPTQQLQLQVGSLAENRTRSPLASTYLRQCQTIEGNMGRLFLPSLQREQTKEQQQQQRWERHKLPPQQQQQRVMVTPFQVTQDRAAAMQRAAPEQRYATPQRGREDRDAGCGEEYPQRKRGDRDEEGSGGEGKGDQHQTQLDKNWSEQQYSQTEYRQQPRRSADEEARLAGSVLLCGERRLMQHLATAHDSGCSGGTPRRGERQRLQEDDCDVMNKWILSGAPRSVSFPSLYSSSSSCSSVQFRSLPSSTSLCAQCMNLSSPYRDSPPHTVFLPNTQPLPPSVFQRGARAAAAHADISEDGGVFQDDHHFYHHQLAAGFTTTAEAMAARARGQGSSFKDAAEVSNSPAPHTAEGASAFADEAAAATAVAVGLVGRVATGGGRGTAEHCRVPAQQTSGRRLPQQDNSFASITKTEKAPSVSKCIFEKKFPAEAGQQQDSFSASSGSAQPTFSRLVRSFTAQPSFGKVECFSSPSVVDFSRCAATRRRLLPLPRDENLTNVCSGGRRNRGTIPATAAARTMQQQQNLPLQETPNNSSLRRQVSANRLHIFAKRWKVGTKASGCRRGGGGRASGSRGGRSLAAKRRPHGFLEGGGDVLSTPFFCSPATTAAGKTLHASEAAESAAAAETILAKAKVRKSHRAAGGLGKGEDRSQDVSTLCVPTAAGRAAGAEERELCCGGVSRTPSRQEDAEDKEDKQRNSLKRDKQQVALAFIAHRLHSRTPRPPRRDCRKNSQGAHHFGARSKDSQFEKMDTDSLSSAAAGDASAALHSLAAAAAPAADRSRVGVAEGLQRAIVEAKAARDRCCARFPRETPAFTSITTTYTATNRQGGRSSVEPVVASAEEQARFFRRFPEASLHKSLSSSNWSRNPLAGALCSPRRRQVAAVKTPPLAAKSAVGGALGRKQGDREEGGLQRHVRKFLQIWGEETPAPRSSSSCCNGGAVQDDIAKEAAVGGGAQEKQQQRRHGMGTRIDAAQQQQEQQIIAAQVSQGGGGEAREKQSTRGLGCPFFSEGRRASTSRGSKCGADFTEKRGSSKGIERSYPAFSICTCAAPQISATALSSEQQPPCPHKAQTSTWHSSLVAASQLQRRGEETAAAADTSYRRTTRMIFSANPSTAAASRTRDAKDSQAPHRHVMLSPVAAPFLPAGAECASPAFTPSPQLAAAFHAGERNHAVGAFMNSFILAAGGGGAAAAAAPSEISSRHYCEEGRQLITPSGSNLLCRMRNAESVVALPQQRHVRLDGKRRLSAQHCGTAPMSAAPMTTAAVMLPLSYGGKDSQAAASAVGNAARKEAVAAFDSGQLSMQMMAVEPAAEKAAVERHSSRERCVQSRQQQQQQRDGGQSRDEGVGCREENAKGRRKAQQLVEEQQQEWGKRVRRAHRYDKHVELKRVEEENVKKEQEEEEKVFHSMEQQPQLVCEGEVFNTQQEERGLRGGTGSCDSLPGSTGFEEAGLQSFSVFPGKDAEDSYRQQLSSVFPVRLIIVGAALLLMQVVHLAWGALRTGGEKERSQGDDMWSRLAAAGDAAQVALYIVMCFGGHFYPGSLSLETWTCLLFSLAFAIRFCTVLGTVLLEPAAFPFSVAATAGDLPPLQRLLQMLLTQQQQPQKGRGTAAGLPSFPRDAGDLAKSASAAAGERRSFLLAVRSSAVSHQLVRLSLSCVFHVLVSGMLLPLRTRICIPMHAFHFAGCLLAAGAAATCKHLDLSLDGPVYALSSCLYTVVACFCQAQLEASQRQLYLRWKVGKAPKFFVRLTCAKLHPGLQDMQDKRRQHHVSGSGLTGVEQVAQFVRQSQALLRNAAEQNSVHCRGIFEQLDSLQKEILEIVTDVRSIYHAQTDKENIYELLHVVPEGQDVEPSTLPRLSHRREGGDSNRDLRSDSAATWVEPSKQVQQEKKAERYTRGRAGEAHATAAAFSRQGGWQQASAAPGYLASAAATSRSPVLRLGSKGGRKRRGLLTLSASSSGELVSPADASQCSREDTTSCKTLQPINEDCPASGEPWQPLQVLTAISFPGPPLLEQKLEDWSVVRETVERERERYREEEEGAYEEGGPLRQPVNATVDFIGRLGIEWDVDFFKLNTLAEGNSLRLTGEVQLSPLVRPDGLRCELRVLRRFLHSVQRQYRETNPYHNQLHAAMVSHCCLAMVGECLPSRDALSHTDEVCLCVAALTHDMGHPGLTNQYLISSQSLLATTYNDIAVLENYHAACCFRTAGLCESLNIFAGLPKDIYYNMRQNIIGLILATDMSKHISYISRLRVRSEAGSFSLAASADRWLFFQACMKAADLGHTATDWQQHKRWSECLCEEFYRQGDEERRQGLPIVETFDRRMTHRFPQSQCRFIEVVVQPLLETIISVETLLQGRGGLKNIVARHAANNRLHWRQLTCGVDVSDSAQTDDEGLDVEPEEDTGQPEECTR